MLTTLGVLLTVAPNLSARPKPAIKRLALTCTAQRNISPDPMDVTAIECRGLKGFFVSSKLYRQMRQKELRHDNLAEQNLLYELQAKELRLALNAKTRSASISEGKAAFYKDAYEAEAEAHQDANEDIRAMSSTTDIERILWTATGVGLTVLAAWAMGQITPN